MLNKVVRNILNAKTRFFLASLALSFSRIRMYAPSFRSKICSKITSFYLFINYS